MKFVLLPKMKRALPLSWMLLIVVLAFTLMVISSSFFVKDMLRSHLRRDADEILTQTQLEIEYELMEPRTTLDVIAETIRGMILSGESKDDVLEYMQTITGKLLSKEEGTKVNPLYGYFEVFDNAFLHGQGWVPPDDYEPTERTWYEAAVKAGDRSTYSELYVDVRTNESHITCVRRIFDDEGQPLGIICMDISLEFFRDTVINMSLSTNGYGVLLDENNKVIIHENDSFAGEYMREVNVGFSDLMDDLDKGIDIYEREALNYKGQWTVVYSHALDYGWHLLVVTPKSEYYQELSRMQTILTILGGVLALILCVILFRIEAARIRADELKKKADQANQLKSDFLATVSHEIRTPMNAILGIAEMQMTNQNLEPEISEMFEKIYTSGDLLLGIINDILDLSKIESGKLELMPGKYEVASLLNDTVYLNMMRYENKPIEFKLDVDENIPNNLIGDDLRIKQILNNILSNSFKYTEEGSVKMSVNTQDFADNNNQVMLVFKVEDTGQGMTAEEVDRLFDKYTRFNLSNNRSIVGAGLGMSITQNLVNMMNGEIQVTSEPQKGTIFTVRLPQGKVNDKVFGKELAENMQQFRFTKVAQVRKAQIVRTPMPYGSVLIVDDTETNLDVAKLLLSPYDLQIETVNSGFKAISKIEHGNIYDIIFMDHMMPKMDGIEAVKHIRELGYQKPIVALTANAVKGQAEIFLNNGFDEFISKPIDIRQMNTILNKLIRDKYFPKEESE